MLYKLTIREGIVQRVQFLYVDKSRIVYLLFFLEGLFVHLYQVPTRHRQGGVEITAQPNLVSVVVKQFLWFEWDRQRSCLYVLQKSKQQNNLSTSSGDLSHQNSPSGNKYQCKTSESKLKHCVLQCYHFPDKAYRQTWEIPLLFHITRPPSPSSANLSGSQSSPSPSPSPASSEPSFYHGLDHRARSSFSRYIHLVRLNGVCSFPSFSFLFSIPPLPLPPSLRITILSASFNHLLFPSPFLSFPLPSFPSSFNPFARSSSFCSFLHPFSFTAGAFFHSIYSQ